MIQEHTIKAILVTETSDDEAFFNLAMDVVKKVIRTQKTDDVDTVSGATYSSKGLLNAIKNALKQAEKVIYILRLKNIFNIFRVHLGGLSREC